MPTADYPFYTIWTASLNLGDTPGVFSDAAFAGLILQLPLTITYVPESTEPLIVALTTSEVEIFNGKTHAVYFDWIPGSALPAPIGYIDDTTAIPGRPEVHLLTIPHAEATVGRHSITIIVNFDVPAGFRDDFVLNRVEVHESFGAKVGW